MTPFTPFPLLHLRPTRPFSLISSPLPSSHLLSLILHSLLFLPPGSILLSLSPLHVFKSLHIPHTVATMQEGYRSYHDDVLEEGNTAAPSAYEEGRAGDERVNLYETSVNMPYV